VTLPPTGFAVENRGTFVGVVCVGLATIVTPVLVVPKLKLGLEPRLELEAELEVELVVVDVLGVELVVEG
jgi:hypothetical protein